MRDEQPSRYAGGFPFVCDSQEAPELRTRASMPEGYHLQHWTEWPRSSPLTGSDDQRSRRERPCLSPIVGSTMKVTAESKDLSCDTPIDAAGSATDTPTVRYRTQFESSALLVIDTQVDFVRPGSAGARAPSLARLRRRARQRCPSRGRATAGEEDRGRDVEATLERLSPHPAPRVPPRARGRHRRRSRLQLRELSARHDLRRERARPPSCRDPGRDVPGPA